MFPTPGLRSQDRPEPHAKDDWYRTFRETPFERATFPFVLVPDSKTKTGAYISFPLEHVTGHVVRADLKLLMENGNPEVHIDENGIQRDNVVLTLQIAKTSKPNGFCLSVRKLAINEVSDTTFECSFPEDSSLPKMFYLTVHIPYWVGRVTIVDVKLTGSNFIEKEIADKREEAAIMVWIKQLGSESFQERQAAQHQLLEMGEKAIPLLKEVELDRDPERRERAKTALEILEKKQRDRFPPVRIE